MAVVKWRNCLAVVQISDSAVLDLNFLKEVEVEHSAHRTDSPLAIKESAMHLI